MNNDHEHRPSFGDRFLNRLANSMNRKLQYLWHHRREAHDDEAAKRLDGYGKAYDGPARKMLDMVEQRTREGGPGWREKPLPGLEPTALEQNHMRYEAELKADEQRRRDAFERRPMPILHVEEISRSIWEKDMREAEDMALKAAAVENTHDHEHGR